ncbi:WecB/TagA/CpsF family glycosyltransferase [uncultured Methylobacterium sp.]|uniref:WecB/TagA/CpsF family glycosyltransferase n=1 Tax=uncultured Methylobacterium sp. TaxID=157278 RepID=UPI0035C95DA5
MLETPGPLRPDGTGREPLREPCPAQRSAAAHPRQIPETERGLLGDSGDAAFLRPVGRTPPGRSDGARGTGSARPVRMFGQAFAAGPAFRILAAAAARPKTGPRLVVTANVDHIVLLSQDAAFRAAYAGAAARTLDGTPLVWLARLRGHPAVRVTGHDLLASACFERPAAGQRIFLVCARENVAQAMRHRLVQSGVGPGSIATCVPPYGFDRDAAYGQALAARILAHGTTLLVMGVGAPRSEIWVDRQGAALGAPVVLAVGDALGVAAGLVPRAPVLLQRAGLEWAFRFAHAPRRLFRRYFVRSWRFLGLAAREVSDGSSRMP